MPDRLFSDADLAALYDAFCPRETRADFDFYLPMIMSAQSVLDVGCGTGALLHEVWDAGTLGGWSGWIQRRGCWRRRGGARTSSGCRATWSRRVSRAVSI